MNHDIFISYSRYDSGVVNKLVALLEQEGYSVWIDRDGIESGEDFKRVILNAIKESRLVLFFSSEHSNVSDWTAKEIGVAVRYKKHIVPIKLDDSNFNAAVEFDLINLDYVDYSKASIRKAMLEKLLRTVRNKLGRGSKEFERLEVEREAQEAANLTNPSAKAKPKSKKGLWIGLGALAALVLLLIILFVPSAQTSDTGGFQTSDTGGFNGYDYVDLGLPSGTLWATCNVGATTPEGCGDYFAWGETRPKTIYNWSTYKYANGDYNQLTKYCSESSYGYYGFTDNLIVLQPTDDAAAANWGEGWQTPSRAQWEELLRNTTNQWTAQNGVKGRLFTAKNGQMLFLPAADDRWDSELGRRGIDGAYWSRSININSASVAENLFLCSACSCYMSYSHRCDGHMVRPVRQK